MADYFGKSYLNRVARCKIAFGYDLTLVFLVIPRGRYDRTSILSLHVRTIASIERTLEIPTFASANVN